MALLAAGADVRADLLADVRASLARLTAREEIAATVTLETSRRSDDDQQPEIGRATVAAEHGPQGLRLTYSPELIARSRQEAREEDADPERPTPARTGMTRMDAAALLDSLDGAAVLARLMESATQVKEQRVNAGGRVLRQLTMTVKPKLSKADAKRVRSLEISLVVNVGDDAIPVSAERRQKLKAKFLLMTFENETLESWTYARTGDRLVALRNVQRSSGSGMGQKFENTRTLTVALANGRP
jgi:hypothetical protein